MTDSNEPTAWEDINPQATGLAPQRGPRLPSSERLAPASSDVFRNELTACLTLVAPVGMTEEAKRDWLAVAWETLKDLPPDLLSRGCRVARETCDHPSKIVPVIMAETREQMGWRRNAAHSGPLLLEAERRKRDVMDRRGEAMSEEDTAELNSILENLGATARYRPDGSRTMIEDIARRLSD